MSYRIIDDYVIEVTIDMTRQQRDEVSRELQTRIMNSADALATERKTAVNDAIVSEVLANMGPADRMTASYPKPKIGKCGRPMMVPHASRTDMVVEAISLSGLLVNLGLLAIGVFNLPEVIPTYMGLSGGIYSYGNKWMLLLLLFTAGVLLYVLMTIVNRYPYILNYPTIVTEENAPKLYRLARSLMRWMKAIFVWMTASMAWVFIMVLPYHPVQSIDSMIILFTPLIVMVVTIGYFVIKIYKVSYPVDKISDSQ